MEKTTPPICTFVRNFIINEMIKTLTNLHTQLIFQYRVNNKFISTPHKTEPHQH